MTIEVSLDEERAALMALREALKHLVQAQVRFLVTDGPGRVSYRIYDVDVRAVGWKDAGQINVFLVQAP